MLLINYQLPFLNKEFDSISLKNFHIYENGSCKHYRGFSLENNLGMYCHRNLIYSHKDWITIFYGDLIYILE